MNLSQRLAQRPVQKSQLTLRSELEQALAEIRDVAISKLHDAQELSKEMRHIYRRANASLAERMLHDSFCLGIILHENQFRENSDPYIVHSFEVGYILASIGADPATVAAGVLHDVIEENRSRKEEIMNFLHQYMGEDVLYLVSTVSSIPLEDPALSKFNLAEKITREASKDPDKKAYAIKSADRLSNLRTLHLLQSRPGRSAEERRAIILRDTVENVIPLARITDKKYSTRASSSGIKLADYMQDLIRRYNF